MAYWQNRQNQRVPLPTTTIPKNHLFEVASEVRNQLINTIEEGTRHGKEYKRGDYIHIASAPGEPPVTDSGELVNSISQPNKVSDTEYIISILSQYAMYLELGTVNMLPRPFVDRSIAEAVKELKSRGVL